MNVRIILLLALAFAAAGCGVKHIRALSDAEVIFNRAAAADNRDRATTQAGVVTAASAVADYRLAGKLLDDLLQKKTAELKTDSLFCTAVALQALSRWRTGQTDAAMASAGAGAECHANPETLKKSPRDGALIRALPGLVRIDQAKAMVDNASRNDAAAIESLTRDAQSDLSAASALVPGDSPVRVYLLLAHLAAVRVLQESITSEARDAAAITAVNTAYKAAGACWLFRYKQVKGAEGEAFDRSVEAWRNLLSLVPVTAEPDGCPSQ